MKKELISPQDSMSFSDYFKLSARIDEVLDYLGYKFEVSKIDLPKSKYVSENVEFIKKRIDEISYFVPFESEIARREFLIAPILSEVSIFTKTKLNVEYAIEVNNQLKGTFDYYLKGKHNLLVIEAKNADTKRGITQLAVELIALDVADETDETILYGAVSIGELWRFGYLDRKEKTFYEDVTFFAIPLQLTELMHVLIGILE